MKLSKKMFFVAGTVVFVLLVFTIPIAIANWWDSGTYPYAYEVNSAATIAGIPISLNDTDGVGTGNTIIWTNNESTDQQWLVSAGTGVTGAISVGNTTDEAFWENETDMTGNNPQSVWASDYLIVYHMQNLTVLDSTSNGIVATKEGDPQDAAGRFDGGVVFDGVDDAYSIPAFGAAIDNDWTQEFWFYPTNGATRQMVLTYEADKKYFWQYDQLADRKLDFTHDAENIVCSDYQELNEWHYVVTIVNNSGNSVYYYINNTLCGFDTSLSDTDKAAINYIGAYASGSLEFIGRIDELRFSTVARSEDYMAANWEAGQNNLARLGAQEEPEEIHDSETLLFLNDTQANRSYEVGEYANFTVSTNITGGTVFLDSNYTGWEPQSGTTSYENSTYLSTIGNDFNMTGYIEGNATVNPSNQTFYFNVTIPTAAAAVATDFGVLIRFITDGFKIIMVR